MSSLQYKENSKCKVAVAIVAVFILFAYYMDLGSIITGFKGMDKIGLYVGLRDVLPAVLVVIFTLGAASRVFSKTMLL